MQKISVWKVLLLSFVTLGLYWFYWIVTRRDDMVRLYKQAIPHWGWMVAPPLLVAISLIPIAFVGVAASINTYDLTMWVMVYAVSVLTVAYAISVWWMWKFSQAAEQLTNGRMTKGWTIALYVFTGLFVIPFLQYYFNHSKSVKAVKAKTTLAPTLKFKIAATVTMALVTVICVLSLFLDWGVMQVPNRANGEVQVLFTKTERLYAEYQGCIDKLGTDFPELTAETEASYNTAQAHCESIRVEQNKAVDEYNKMTGH